MQSLRLFAAAALVAAALLTTGVASAQPSSSSSTATPSASSAAQPATAKPAASAPADEGTTSDSDETTPGGKRKKKRKQHAELPAPTTAATILEVTADELGTLARPLEPVIVRAGAVPAWLGSPIASLRAFALNGGKLHPVPFQVDERAADGRYLYPDGIRNDQVEIDGMLTSEDEIVLLASDAGDRPPSDMVVPEAAATQLVSVEAPASAGEAASSPTRGWFVLARYDATPPTDTLATDPRVVHEWANNYVYSAKYSIGFYDFAPPAHSAVPREIRVHEGPDVSADLLDRFKWRVEIGILWGLYTVRFDEQNVRVQVLAYKNGPVRVLRYVACRVILPFGIEGPSLTIDAAFYPNMIQIPLVLNVPRAPGFVGTHSDLILGVDLSPAANGLVFYDSENTGGFLVDGWMSEAEKAQAARPDRWRLWTGKAGTLVERTFWDPEYLKTVGLTVEYIDDSRDARPPEDHTGQNGAYFERYRVDDLAAGTYRALLEWYFPSLPDYLAGNEAPVLAIRDQPLRIRVGDWEGPAMPPPPNLPAASPAAPQP